MRITGIPAEYNPFHNGHRYHIQKARELTDADGIAAVMSGSFTQRGEAAIMDKWIRAKLAAINGADLVLELPLLYACAPAPVFAEGSVDILVRSGATHICFGSESGDIDLLRNTAAEMTAKEDEIKKIRDEIMGEGFSFAKANQLASEQIIGRKAVEVMLSPNNILALEYLKRIMYWETLGRHIEPVTVRRNGSGYFDANEAGGFAGATVIRDMLASGRDISSYVPQDVSVAAADSSRPSDELMFQLVRAEIIRKTPKQLSQIYCVGEGLEHKLKKEAVTAGNLRELISSVVSKRYTEAAVRRILVYILLGTGRDTVYAGKYARVLAAGAQGRKMIRWIKKSEAADIPVITNVNKEAHCFPEIQKALETDILAADMYNILSGRDLYRFSDRVVCGHFI